MGNPELWQRLQKGDEQALAELYNQFSNQVFGFLLRILEDQHDAEEVLQDIFLKIYHEAKRYTLDSDSIAPVLYTIARNSAISRLRMRRSRPSSVEQDANDQQFQEFFAVHSIAKQAIDKVTIEKALAKLETDERMLLEANFFQGFSHQELAEQTGLPLGTVKAKLRRALLTLRNHLENR